jgi:hypothetical protein
MIGKYGTNHYYCKLKFEKSLSQRHWPVGGIDEQSPFAAIIQDRRNEKNNDNNISIHYDNKLWTNDCSIC